MPEKRFQARAMPVRQRFTPYRVPSFPAVAAPPRHHALAFIEKGPDQVKQPGLPVRPGVG